MGDPGELIAAVGLVEALLNRPSRHAGAACRGQGTALFYPGRGESLAPAREVCAGCPVESECLSAALEVSYHDDAGVWGGTSSRQRRELGRTATGEAA